MADIAIFRINYKSDFILTLNSDAGWMTPFCIKFWTGAPSQAYFAGYDGTTYTHCAPVEGDPTKLVVQFDDHHLPVGDLTFQIGYHFTVADFPTSVEDEVLNQASVIIEQDGEPAQVMLDFNGETAPEIEFSLPAYANEAQRITNEQARIEAEQQRIANEDARIQAEETRQQNEQQRIAHETNRINEFATLKSQSQAATSAANAAATLANEKAQLAADKAALAQAAATLANDKAQLAADKAALAQAAATLANDKAALAQQKAAYAQTQGDYAKAQGDYAKAQGDTAQADHERAEADHATAASDHSRAESDHTTAASDHSRAETDHTTAASDHSRAETDHTTAASDHSRAESDHTTAAADHSRAESDHTTAAADHETAASDHTRAESDHAAVEVYVDSLGAFDISSYHATGGVLAKYADLSAALGTDGANIPEGIRKGGMSVKFVQSSDNKYVQYRLTAQNWTNDVTCWEKVLIESDIESNIDIAYNAIGKYINVSKSDGTISSYSTNSLAYYPIIYGMNYHIVVEKTTNPAGWEIGYASVADGSTPISEILTRYGIGTADSAIFDIESTFTGYLVVGYTTGTALPVVKENNIPSSIDKAFLNLDNKIKEETTRVEILRTDVDKKAEYTKVSSKNLINPAEVQLNRYIGYNNSTGFSTLSAQPSYVEGGACSGFIPVTPGKTYYLTRAISSTSAAFVFLDADYKPLSATPALDPTTGETLPWLTDSVKNYVNQSRAYKAPEGAVYALICLAFSGWTNTQEQIVGFQFEEGDTPTEYEPYYVREIIPNEHLPEEIVELPDRVEDLQEQIDNIVGETTKTFVYNQERDAVSYIEGKFGDSVIKNNFKVLRSVGRSGGTSECFNFETFTIDGVNVHSATDDITPISFGGNGGYLGANHGCDAFYNCVSNNHGKTYSDIGAEYSDGSHTFVIMDIIDNNNLILADLNSSKPYPYWQKASTPSNSTYEWVSGGSEHSSFTVTFVTLAQGKPLEKLDDTKVFVDGKEISNSGTYLFKDRVIVSQNYLIANPKSVWDIVKQNVGNFTDHPNYPNLAGVEFCVKLNISYIYTDAAHCFVTQTLVYLQNQLLQRFGFIQVGTIQGTANKLYFPKCLPISGLDFRTNPSYNATEAATIRDMSTEYWENPNLPPDRFIYNNANIAFNGGYLFDYGIAGEHRKDYVSDACYLATNQKIYINGIDRGTGDTRYNQVAGAHYSTVAFRIYKPGSEIGTGVFMNNCFEYDGKYYLYLDFNAVGLYNISIPEKFIGKTVTLFEKSDNVELLTPVTSDSILIDVKTANPMYGYLIGKIE